MTRIFIIDDETPIRQWIRFCIQRSGDDFEIAGEAANGEDGLKALETTDADIVILDITMPGINGLDVISRLNTVRPDLSVIMLTNFAEFDYIQKAVRNGAVEYFLKSEITEETLMECLKKTASVRRQNSLKLQQTSEIDFHTVHSLCEQILNHTITDQTQFLKKSGTFPIPSSFKSNLFVIAIRYEQGLPNPLSDIAPEDICEYLSTMYQITVNGRGCFLICEMNKLNSQLMIFNSISGMLQWISSHIAFAYMGVSNIYHGFDLLYQAMTEALLSLDAGFYKKPGSVTYIYETKETTTPNQELLSTFTREVLEAAKTGTQDVLCQKLSSVFEYFQSSMPSPSFVKDYFLELLYLIYSVFMSNEQQFHRFNNSLRKNIHRTLTDAVYLDELHQAVLEFLPRLHAEENAQALNSPVADTIAYIREHYCENITLKDAAKAVHMNADYLGKLFKKETGCSFNSYLTGLKMDYADFLVRNTNLKKYEIAEKLGYTNFSYFSRIYSAYRSKSTL